MSWFNIMGDNGDSRIIEKGGWVVEVVNDKIGLL